MYYVPDKSRFSQLESIHSNIMECFDTFLIQHGYRPCLHRFYMDNDAFSFAFTLTSKETDVECKYLLVVNDSGEMRIRLPKSGANLPLTWDTFQSGIFISPSDFKLRKV